MDFVGYLVAAILTLMVYSYLVGDNPLYRVAQHLFVGVSVGIVSLVVLYNVILPPLAFLISRPNTATILFGSAFEPAHRLLLLALILGFFVLFKITRPRNVAANTVLGFVVGVGAAIALGGALLGTLVPQVLASTGSLLNDDPIKLLGNIVLLVGVVTSLSYFYFTARRDGTRPPLAQYSATVGRWFITVAFGAIFGTLTISFFAALFGRIDFLVTNFPH